MPLNDYEDLPFAPGLSPFRIKGIAYRGHVEYASRHIPGGVAAVNETFGNKALKYFFEQQFLAATWYDVLPMVPLWHACARVLKQPAVEFLRVRTRHQAEGDLRGVYRWILKVASPETVALRMPRAVGQYLDFGTTEATVRRPGVVHVRRTGIPLFLAPWFGIVAETFLTVALEIAGASKVQLRQRPVQTLEEGHGLRLSTLEGDVLFDTPSVIADRSAG